MYFLAATHTHITIAFVDTPVKQSSFIDADNIVWPGLEFSTTIHALTFFKSNDQVWIIGKNQMGSF